MFHRVPPRAGLILENEYHIVTRNSTILFFSTCAVS